MRGRLTLLLVVLGLASCGPATAVHDKPYFTAHPQERAKMLADCRSDPGRLGTRPNCINAIQSEADAEHQRVFHGDPPPAIGVTNSSHL